MDIEKVLNHIEKYQIYDDDKINNRKVLKIWENVEGVLQQNQHCSVKDANRIIEMVQSQAPFSGSDLIYELVDTLKKCTRYPVFPKLRFSLVEHPGWQNFMDSVYHTGHSLMDANVFLSFDKPLQDIDKFIKNLDVVGPMQLSHKMYLLYVLSWRKESPAPETVVKVDSLLNQDGEFHMYEDSYYWGAVENWQQLIAKQRFDYLNENI